MKYVFIHGIGDHKPDWLNLQKVSELLDIPKDQIILFEYESLMEKSLLNKALVLAYKMMAPKALGLFSSVLGRDGMPDDYLNDILVYFLGYKTREKILDALDDIILYKDEAMCLVGHSLGSVVAYDALERSGQPMDKLITLGSPLSKSIVRKLRKDDAFLLNVVTWVNLYAPILKDPISGRIPYAHENIECDTTHGIDGYLKYLKAIL